MAPNQLSELITLNVGGRLFTTTRDTLTKHPDSMLCAMFRGDMQASGLSDEQGNPFLDRDPTHFPLILAYLRDGHVPPLPQSLLELQQIKAEAAYFAMVELAAAVEAQMAELQAADKEDRQNNHVSSYLERQRAEVVGETCEAINRANAKYVQAGEQLAPHRAAEQAAQRVVEQASQRIAQLIAAHRAAAPAAAAQQAGGAPNNAAQQQAAIREALQQAQQAEHDANTNLHQVQEWMRPVQQAHDEARSELRQAYLARLYALGTERTTAEEQLQVTHPQLFEDNGRWGRRQARRR